MMKLECPCLAAVSVFGDGVEGDFRPDHRGIGRSIQLEGVIYRGIVGKGLNVRTTGIDFRGNQSTGVEGLVALHEQGR